jgi:outer membrane cobalamin receptor
MLVAAGWWLIAVAASATPAAPAADRPIAVKQEIVVTAARDEQPRDQASAAVTLLDR